MDKKVSFLICWEVNVFALLLLIVLPKKAELYGIFSVVTLLMIFVVPLVLTAMQAYKTIKSNTRGSIYDVIPNIGSFMVILLTFIKFIGSIENIAIAQMVTILILFIAVELLLGYLKYEYSKMTLKQYIMIEIATYVSLVVFFMCAIIISVDYGLI